MRLDQVFQRYRLIPVVEVTDPQSAGTLAGALVDAGLPIVEVTFRTPAAADAISKIKTNHPEVTVGAGTLITKNQVHEAFSSGADFGVSPGLNLETLSLAKSLEFEFVPGVNTPSEIELGLQHELNIFKIFPAEPIGALKLLPAFLGPYPLVKFMPTGGITLDNFPEYLGNQNVVACGGTWIAPRNLIEAQDFSEIYRRAKRTVELVDQLQNIRKEN